jgi:putative ABC transport system permease protein
MRTLDRKLLRDLARMKAQAAAVALVVAAGVALFIATVTAYRALRVSEARYYGDKRFAHVFASFARAPRSLARDVARVPGVAAVEDRIVVPALLDVPDLVEPASALVVSMPEQAGHALNDLHVRRGRHVAPSRAHEAMIDEAFARANRLGPGDRVVAVLAGRRVELEIVGVAMSPEYVMALAPGALVNDDKHFTILWMARPALEAVADMRGVSNDLAVLLAPGAGEAPVIRAIDRLLEPYGGRGAHGRATQRSYLMVAEHLVQLRALALLVPTVFLLVSAFLVNVVMSRHVATQREQIGVLKAFGYSTSRIALHYLELTVAVAALGIAFGIPFGAWLGHVIAVFYASFFRFPVLVFELEASTVALSALVSAGAALAGALGMLRSVAAIPPVVAMAGEPLVFRASLLDRIGASRFVPPISRTIARNIARRPLRSGLTTAGMSFAVAIMVMGGSTADGIERMAEVEYQLADRADVRVMLDRRRALGTLGAIEALPGVSRAEPLRVVPARVLARGRHEDVTLLGLPSGAVLRRAAGNDGTVAVPPTDGGLVASRWLCERLGLERGSELVIEIWEGRRQVIRARLAAMVDDPHGANLYMDLQALGRELGEPETYSVLSLDVDPVRERELYETLERSPHATLVSSRKGAIAGYHAMSDDAIRFVRRIEILFAVVIAFGVVYNAARIALAERAREMATLRVLGLTRGEVSRILLGELLVLAAPAVPLGLALGYLLSAAVSISMSGERMHIPVIVEPSTYAFAVVVFAMAAVASALLVRRGIDELDLPSVLKARE